MGQADDRHLRSHHRVGGVAHLFQGLEQHLPHPRQRPHRQPVGHVAAPRPLVRADGGIVGRTGRDLDHADPVGDLGQVAQHRQRIGAVRILPGQFGQRRGRIAAHHHVEQIQHPAPVRQPQHGAHLLGGGLSRAVADRLVEQALRVAGRAFGGAGDQRQRLVRDGRPLRRGDAAQHGDHLLRLDPAQVEPLAARQDGDRHLADLGGGEDELHVGGGFLQRLQERVERAGRQHVDLVDDVDLVARRGRRVADRRDDVVADVAHPGLRRAVHLHHVHVAPFGDGAAGLARAAGADRGAALPVRADAIHPLGDDPRGGGLSGAADAGHDEGLGDAVGLERVAEHPHHGVLADQIGEGLGAVLAGKDLVGGGVWHGTSVGSGEMGRLGAGARPD
ncbi:hypothetical protein PARU111607_16605 [Palleronia rufa]